MIKPILFNTEMVRAIQEGRKTVTRRVIKPQPDGSPLPINDSCWPGYFGIEGTPRVIEPPYQPGDVLWVRETWSVGHGDYLYRAWTGTGMEPQKQDEAMRRMGLTWRPSIHMPKDAARLFLRVTDVRAERLQSITDEQARAEGCDGRCSITSSGAEGPILCTTMDFSRERFETVWDSTLKSSDRDKYGWDADPWVWVITFLRSEKPKNWP
jgi:hypothetical protein